MKIQNLPRFAVAFMIVASFTGSKAFGQSAERDDSLKPYTSCVFESGLRIAQLDRLPKNNKSREVETSKGQQNLSLDAGSRVLTAYHDRRDWFANIKAEKSISGEYERDKEGVIENLKYTASRSTNLETPEPIKASFNGFEGYGISNRTLTGNLVGIYLLLSDVEQTITTIYFINQNANRKRFKTIEEWQVVRDEFLNTYTTCINNNAKILRGN